MTSSRRQFLKAGVAVGAAVGSARWLWGQAGGAGGAAGASAPSNTVNVAFIGVGGQGRGNLNRISSCEGVRVVAMADVDATRFDPALKVVQSAATRASRPESQVKTYADYRKMLDEMGKDVDAVVVSTPDHTHAPAAMMAMALGKHCYCEKPLTYTIREARALTHAARKHKVATQMGNSHHSAEWTHQTVEFIKSGALGKIREMHCWTNRPVWPQGVGWAAGQAAPETMNWDLWLGPTTRKVEYNPAYAPFKWRGYWEWGTGALGDMACHVMDGPNWALGLSRPESVEAEMWGATEASYPVGSTVRYAYGAEGDRPTCTLTWYDGKKDGQPNLPELSRWMKLPASGTVWVGEKGTAVTDYTKGVPVLVDASLEVKRPEPTVPAGRGHFQDWVDACRGGKPAGSNFDYAGPLTEMVLLGVLALRGAGKKLEWDAEKMEVRNEASMNQYVTREYRKGWEVEGA